MHGMDGWRQLGSVKNSRYIPVGGRGGTPAAQEAAMQKNELRIPAIVITQIAPS
jgi:hypothetical protein